MKKNQLFININNAPNPHAFVNLSLQSSIVELTEVMLKINEQLPQLSNFIDQFNHIVSSTSINVITDTSENMAIDVPSSMPDEQAGQLSKRIAIIDRLITASGQNIDSLLQKGLGIESKLREQDPNFSSQILGKVNEFKRLNNSYRH